MPAWGRMSWNRKADRPTADPYDSSTVPTRYSGATTARSRSISTTKTPSTVITPTRLKSFDSTVCTSENCAVGPPRYALAPVPNGGAAAASACWLVRTVENADDEYGSSDVTREKRGARWAAPTHPV